MSMMIHRKREALRRKAEQMQKSESSTPDDVMTGAVVEDTAPVVDNVEEGEDISPAPVRRGRKKKV